MLPVWSDQPTFINKTSNGLKFMAQPSADFEAPLLVLHLYGTPYEMGLAYGQLLRAEINDVLPKVAAYMEEQVAQNLPATWPTVIRNALETYGLEFALNLTYELTKPYTPPHFLETLLGMADGSGVPYANLTWVAMIPELIKAQCSIAGSYGSATPTGSMVQLRALDWGTDGPFQQYPLLLTWHPGTGNGTTFTTLTWAGLLGAITGWSSSGMGVSEKVWDAYKGPDSIAGVPFHFLLQDILQFDGDTDAALSRIASAERTCSIWIGLGDKNNQEFHIVGYSWEQVAIYNPRNCPVYPNHDRYTDLMFINKHVQPSSEPCMNDVYNWLYPGNGTAGAAPGNVTAVNTFRYVTALEQTGNMHIAVYDFGADTIYLSNASPGDGHGNNVTNAYDRQFLSFNMTQLWATQVTDY